MSFLIIFLLQKYHVCIISNVIKFNNHDKSRTVNVGGMKEKNHEEAATWGFILIIIIIIYFIENWEKMDKVDNDG